MGHRAKKIYLARSNEDDLAGSARTALYDFTQPWLALADKSALVTAGMAALDEDFVRNVIGQYRPQRLAVFSRDALKQRDMRSLLPAEEYPFMHYFAGDASALQKLLAKAYA